MSGPIVTRRMQCPQCGAGHQVLDDALVVVCEHCDAFVAIQAEKHWGGQTMAKRQAEQLRALVDPTWADARKMQAGLGMAEAQAQNERVLWRMWASEYYALLPSTDPTLVPVDPDDARKMARWVRSSVKAAELSTFDPHVWSAQQRFASAAGKLYTPGDAVVAARTALDEAEKLYITLLEHPEYPQELVTGDPIHMARELLRTTLVGAATILGPEVVTRIRHEVLSDEIADPATLRCGGCGVSLPVEHGTQRCPACGTVVEVAIEDPWLTIMLGLWQTTRDQAQDDPAEAMLALTLGLSSYFTREVLPSPDALRCFLLRGPSWISSNDLHAAIELMRHGYDSDPPVLKWLDDLDSTLASWTPHGQRPALEISDPPPRAATPDDPNPSADPWVTQTLALWNYRQEGQSTDPSTFPMTIIGYILNPFYLGASISTTQALAFIDALEPRPDDKALTEAVELMIRAEASHSALPMLEDLAEMLRNR